MKHQTILLTLLATAAFAVGCDKEKTPAQQIETIKAETKAAAIDMKDYTFSQKAEFTAAMQNQLTALDQDLDTLSAKIDKSSDAVKAEAKPKLQALRDQASELNKQLNNIKDSTETTWDSVKASSQKAWDSLKDGVISARKWTADKIAP